MPRRSKNDKAGMAATAAPTTETGTAPLAPLVVETSRDRFLRLGRRRLNRAVEAIRLIGNLSSPAYDWDNKDVEHIERILTTATKDALSHFSGRKRLDENSINPFGIRVGD